MKPKAYSLQVVKPSGRVMLRMSPLKKAAELAKLDEYYTSSYPHKGSWIDNFMPKENKGSYLDSKLQAEIKALLGDLYEPLMEIRQSIQDGNTIQARMLENTKVK